MKNEKFYVAVRRALHQTCRPACVRSTSFQEYHTEMAKHIFVTGGVVSSLGKGITTGAVGLLLKRMGLTVRLQKLDPYLNVDPGTMNPYEHGEVYVTEDGAETDLDLGHYERFTGDYVSRDRNYPRGQIYSSGIVKER